MISRRPVSWTAGAITTHLRATATAVADLLDLRVNRHVRTAALQHALPKRLHLVIEQPAIRLTLLREMRSPRLSTSWSTRRVLTPQT